MRDNDLKTTLDYPGSPRNHGVERAKGIEPSSAAWEAAALPLSYARPVPKDGRLPRRANNPPGGRTQTCLATDHHAEVSALSGRGDHCIPYPSHYSPAFAISAIPYPQQMRGSLHRRLSHLTARHRYGLTLFRAVSTSQEGLAFLPVTVMSACLHQAGRQPVTYRFGSSLSVDLARSSLTAFISDSQMLALWLSLAPHPDFDFQNPTASLTATAYPRGAATLSVRSARGRYQPRTAPRLRAAERPVACRLAPEQQLITRLAPRLQPDPGLTGAHGPIAVSDQGFP